MHFCENGVQCCQHSTAQHSTAQHSTAQHSTAWANCALFSLRPEIYEAQQPSARRQVFIPALWGWLFAFFHNGAYHLRKGGCLIWNFLNHIKREINGLTPSTSGSMNHSPEKRYRSPGSVPSSSKSSVGHCSTSVAPCAFMRKPERKMAIHWEKISAATLNGKRKEPVMILKYLIYDNTGIAKERRLGAFQITANTPQSGGITI